MGTSSSSRFRSRLSAELVAWNYPAVSARVKETKSYKSRQNLSKRKLLYASSIRTRRSFAQLSILSDKFLSSFLAAFLEKDTNSMIYENRCRSLVAEFQLHLKTTSLAWYLGCHLTSFSTTRSSSDSTGLQESTHIAPASHEDRQRQWRT